MLPLAIGPGIRGCNLPRMRDPATSSPEAVGDLQALRSCWHAVAFADAVSDQPQRAVLLGEPLVIWRDSAGPPHALRDLCIHRGTALSLGRVVGDG